MFESIKPYCKNSKDLSIVSAYAAVSLWGMASLMVFSLLPIFLRDEVGVTHTYLGFLEGSAIFIALLAKAFSGFLTDLCKTRRRFILIGGFGTLITKPLFAFAFTPLMVFLTRSADRFFKGVRSSPLDAYIADMTSKKIRGQMFGLKFSLKTLGNVFGGLLASGLIMLTGSYRLVFLLAILPALLAFYLIYRFLEDPKTIHNYRKLSWRALKRFPKLYWLLLGCVFLLMQARFSEAFLTLRAADLGYSIASLPLLIMGYDIIAVFSSYPSGIIADRLGRLPIVIVGMVILAIANILLILAPSPHLVFFAIILCGLHIGLTHGVLSAIISVQAPSYMRGTAFALYYLTVGFSVFIANIMAGFMADFIAAGPFYYGCFFSILAALSLTWLSKGR